MIAKAKLVRIYNEGMRIELDCTVNTETKEIFDIEEITDESLIDLLQTLQDEFVVINNMTYEVIMTNNDYSNPKFAYTN